MTEGSGKTDDKQPPRRRRHGRVGVGMVFSLFIAFVLIGIATLSLTGRAMPLPMWISDRFEQSLNTRLGDARVDLGRLDLQVGRDGVPRITLNDVRFGDATGGAVAALNKLNAGLSPGALLKGRIAPLRLALSGAEVTLRRDREGRFSVVGQSSQGSGGLSISGMLQAVDEALTADALRHIRDITADNLTLTLEDARSNRIWQATNATLIMRRDQDVLDITVASDVFGGTDTIGNVQVSFKFDHVSHDTEIGVRFSDMPAPDIALQSPIMAWLGVLDAPISGAVRAILDGETGLTGLAGTLDIGSGALQPTPEATPVRFASGRAYFDFDPIANRIDFSELSVLTDEAKLVVDGHAYMAEIDRGWPQAFLGQFNLSTASLVRPDLFESPVVVSSASADLRLRLDPFTLEVAQLMLEADDARVHARGRVRADNSGWYVALDADAKEITTDTIRTHWPLIAAKNTRRWVSENVRAGRVFDISAAVRLEPGQEPDFSLNFDFENAEVSVMQSLPPVQDGRGRATIHNHAYTMVVAGGNMSAPGGGKIEAAGSVFRVGDIRPKPSTGDISVRARGDISDSLILLNNPPFRILDRADRGPDIARGRVDLAAEVSLPLKNGLRTSDVTYHVTGQILDAVSDTLVPGRRLSASRLNVDVTPDMAKIGGRGRLDGLALDATWEQAVGAGQDDAPGQVSGTISLGPELATTFDLPIPAGAITGAGLGDFTLVLAKDTPAALEVSSDLKGVSLELAALGWRKSANAAGGLELSATLGKAPSIDVLALSAPGLALQGQMQLAEGGGLTSAKFESLRIGDWLDASVDLTPDSPGEAPRIRLTGGKVDLRNANFDNGGQRSSGGAPIDLTLDELIVSDGIALAPITGQITTAGGISGKFQARVNGKAEVQGTLVPVNGGTGVRVLSNDAGGVLRSANFIKNGSGGTMDLVLTPVVGQSDYYDGQFLIEKIRMRDAPVMADLLDAISVVGLLDQLNGPGILFETVDGKFRLTPTQVRLTEAAAVGNSIGVSLDGIYDMARKRLNMQGVISPVYFLNGIGALFTRRGEGLFGFSFRMTGAADAPEVRVNPLSILTPGTFREIFRRAPPSRNQ